MASKIEGKSSTEAEMEVEKSIKPRPVFELHAGVLHVTMQRIPGWLVAIVTTGGGAALTWWTQR